MQVEIWTLLPGRGTPGTGPSPSFPLILPPPRPTLPPTGNLLDALGGGVRRGGVHVPDHSRRVRGYLVPAGREVATAIERQTGFAAELYNVDLRPDHRCLAGQGRVPCCGEGSPGSRWTFPLPVPDDGGAGRGHPLWEGACPLHRGGPRTPRTAQRGGGGPSLPTLPALSRPSIPMSCCSPTPTSGCPASSPLQNRRGSCSRSAGAAGTGRLPENLVLERTGKTEYRGRLAHPGRQDPDRTTQSFHYRESGLRASSSAPGSPGFPRTSPPASPPGRSSRPTRSTRRSGRASPSPSGRATQRPSAGSAT